MILSCHSISKSFSERIILQDASFTLGDHEKAALVGINGAGKSTFMKIIVGELAPDEGSVILAKGASVGYLAQQQMLIGNGTIWEELLEAKRDVSDAEQRLRDLENSMKDLSGESLRSAMEQYHTLNEWFEQHNGYALQSEITGVLKGLGFEEEDFYRNTSDLSGGQKTRVALGRLLLSSPDVLLLDEPTNHLDMSSIAWLENYLSLYKGSVLIVAHDRYFLDKVVTKVIEIDQGRVMSFSGNYTDYAAKKKDITDAAMKAWLKQQAEIRHQEEVIEKLRSFNREKSIKRAESREKMLSKMDVLDRPTTADTQMHLAFEPAVQSGKDVLDVSHLSKRFDDLVLFSDLSFSVRRGERIALIGDNGTGKTTILKILNGLVEADSGSFTLGANVMIGYYDQDHQVLHPDKTLFDEISDERPEMTNTQIRNTLAAFLFTGDDVYKRVRDISGGERGRLSLAKLMLSKANFLILDEPTNHLDMFSREILENALTLYTGTVLYVSHDRYFINRTAQRILELSGRDLTVYYGNYDYYLEKKEQALSAQEKLPERGTGTGSATLRGDQPDDAPLRTGSRDEWAMRKEELALSRRRAARLAATEEEIGSLEAEDARIDEQLQDEVIFTDNEKVLALTTRKAQIAQELEELYSLWEELAE